MTTEVVLTCGGTSEPVDDVRVLTNISTGRFGHSLAEELAKLSAYAVTELCPPATLQRLGGREGVTYEHYRSTEDLQRGLYERATTPGVVIQAAAVSDYRPVRHVGKIRSDAETLTIHMERAPKLLAGLREHYGPQTFLVGFKLLSNVSQEELITVAQTQLKKNRLNMVVANDLQDLVNDQHPVLVITAEGGVIPLTGTREEVVKELAALIHKREQVSWFRSVPTEGLKASTLGEERFSKTLAAVQAMNLLTDASGNISVAAGEPGSLLISPRGTDKSKLTLADAIPAVVDTVAQTITYTSDRKPSIDTGVESLIYQAYPEVEAIIHFHRGWGRMAAVTTYPYPCGVREEGEELVACFQDTYPEGKNSPLAAELIHHGFLLGVTMKELHALRVQWDRTLEEFARHINEVRPEGMDAIPDLSGKRVQPIWDGSKIVGLIHVHPRATVIYLREDARGGGLARTLISQVQERGLTIRTVDDCQVRDFYKRFDFTETADEMFYYLTPPKPLLTKAF